MRRTKLKVGLSGEMNIGLFQTARFVKWAAAAVLLTACWPTRSIAQQQGQKTFSSAEEASAALASAADGFAWTRRATPMAAAATIPRGCPVDTPNPIAKAEPIAMLFRRRAFIVLEMVSVDGEWRQSISDRSSDCRSCADDGRRLPRRFRGPRSSARKAMLRGGVPWSPSRAEPCWVGALHSPKFPARTVPPHRRRKPRLA